MALISLPTASWGKKKDLGTKEKGRGKTGVAW